MGANKLMGLDSPADHKVPVRVGDWDGMKRAIWRSKNAFEIILVQAASIIDGCKHEDGCPGATNELDPCFAGCPDREKRMSALVILNAARTLPKLDARRPADGPYFAPSREYFSEVMATLAASQVEVEELRAQMRDTDPPPSEEQQEQHT